MTDLWRLFLGKMPAAEEPEKKPARKPNVIRGFDAPSEESAGQDVDVLTFRDVVPSDSPWLTKVCLSDLQIPLF